MKFFTIIIFLIFIFKDICKTHDSTEKIYQEIYQKFCSSFMSINFEKNNNFYFSLNSSSIFLTYEEMKLSDYRIYLYRPMIIIKYYLFINKNNLYLNIENDDEFSFGDKENNIFNNNGKFIYAILNFNFIHFYKIMDDSSFDFIYNILSINYNININFGELNNSYIFRNILYNDSLNNNETFYGTIKEKVLDSILSKLSDILLYYPESDCLSYFSKIRAYILTNKYFFEEYNSLYSFIYEEIFESISYESIIKKETSKIILSKLEIKMILRGEMKFTTEEYDYFEENAVLILDEISINRDESIEYGKIIKGGDYQFNIFKLIVEKLQSQSLIHI